MRLSRRCATKLLLAPALLGGLRAVASNAGAESYPAKPVRIIVPYPAGGPYDAIPRLIAQWIGARHGWSIIIDNRSGAAGIIGVMGGEKLLPTGTRWSWSRPARTVRCRRRTSRSHRRTS